VRSIKILSVKVINNILSVDEFIIVSVILVEIIVIVLSFDSLLKLSSIYYQSFIYSHHLLLLISKIHSSDQTENYQRQNEKALNETHHVYA